jgi:hypothetical protein
VSLCSADFVEPGATVDGVHEFFEAEDAKGVEDDVGNMIDNVGFVDGFSDEIPEIVDAGENRRREVGPRRQMCCELLELVREGGEEEAEGKGEGEGELSEELYRLGCFVSFFEV